MALCGFRRKVQAAPQTQHVENPTFPGKILETIWLVGDYISLSYGARPLPTREKFDREKFETEYTRIRAERRTRNDEALQELREKNWPRWLKYLAVGTMRVLMLRNEAHHAGGDAARGIRQVA